MELLCAQCGAPLPAEASRAPTTCQYCGTTSVPPPEVVVVGRLEPMAIPTGEPEPPRLPCPRCADWLMETRVREAVLSTCQGCGGVWLDAATVERLKKARDEEIDLAARRIAARGLTGAPPDRLLSIACPVCRRHLQRVAIPGTSQTVDVCDVHGTWFDGAKADELHVFVAAFEAARAGELSGDDDLRPAGLERGFFAKLFGSPR